MMTVDQSVVGLSACLALHIKFSSLNFILKALARPASDRISRFRAADRMDTHVPSTSLRLYFSSMEGSSLLSFFDFRCESFLLLNSGISALVDGGP